jgi:hypothetical protein
MENSNSETWLPFYLSLIATPIGLFLAYITVGPMGHGSFSLAKFIFPYAALSLLVFENIWPVLLLASIQFPIYGIILSIFSAKKSLDWIFLSLLILHILAVILCFMFVRM